MDVRNMDPELSSRLESLKRKVEEQAGLSSSSSSSAGKRKRKSRWDTGSEQKSFIPGMPTVLPANMNPDQERAYLVQLQIEEISRKLRTGDLGIPVNPEDRSPSPEPIYNHEGKRLNTREYRTRKQLEDQRHDHITNMYKLNPEFKPPGDYKPPIQRVSDRVMIPQDDHPHINFVGLLIGPRGNTLKRMEKDYNVKIMIRGKGSIKEGKVGRKDGQPLPGEDEPLHALVSGNMYDMVTTACDEIRQIIETGIEKPEGENELRKLQLRELAKLNGTLRDEETNRCTNCGSTEHRTWQCPEQRNITNSIICTMCGSAGHIAADCRVKQGDGLVDRAANGMPLIGSAKAKMDSEYMSLMAELGEEQVGPKHVGSHHHMGGKPIHHPPRPVGPPRPLMSLPMHPSERTHRPPWRERMPGIPGQRQERPWLNQGRGMMQPPWQQPESNGKPGSNNQQQPPPWQADNGQTQTLPPWQSGGVMPSPVPPPNITQIMSMSQLQGVPGPPGIQGPGGNQLVQGGMQQLITYPGMGMQMMQPTAGMTMQQAYGQTPSMIPPPLLGAPPPPPPPN